MAAGDLAVRPANQGGYVRLYTGTVVKSVPSCGPVGSADVLAASELRRLDEVLAVAEEATGLRFAAYVGDLGADSRVRAEEIVASFGDDAAYTALVAISPQQRIAEIVTGPEAALRISERGARAAILAVVASCADGDLAKALSNGIRILVDHAGSTNR